MEARIILDLRVGAAFTRMQTQILQARFGRLAESSSVVSYGLLSGTFLTRNHLTPHSTTSRPLSISYPRLRCSKVESGEELCPRAVLVHPPGVDSKYVVGRRGRNCVYLEKRAHF